MENKAKTYIYWLSIPSLILIIGVVFAFGYRLQPNGSFAKNGILEITIPLSGSTVFIDDKEKITTVGDTEIIRLSLSTRDHRVIVSRDGYFPWMKEFPITSGETTTLRPFLVTSNPTGEIITDKDVEYATLSDKVKNLVLPTEIHPKVKQGVSLWAQGNALYIHNGSTELIHTFTSPIRSLDFYKDRNDIALIASEQGIFALELIPHASEHTANIFPVYKGNSPIFEKTDDHFITVLDGTSLMQVVIQ